MKFWMRSLNMWQTVQMDSYVHVCARFLPALPPSLLVHPLNICLLLLVPNPSHHLILGCVISPRIICGSHACLCPLCSVLVDGEPFLSINRERFTLQPYFHQRDFLSLLIALHVPVRGYTKKFCKKHFIYWVMQTLFIAWVYCKYAAQHCSPAAERS